MTESRLIEIGFKSIYLPTDDDNKRIEDQFEYRKGSILYGKCGEKTYVNIYSNYTSDLGYAREAVGVKTEEDLLLLCKLVDG